MVQQRVDESALLMARSGVHYHAGGFIDHHHVVVFVEDMEWKFLRHRMQGGQRPRRDVHLFATAQRMGCPDHFAVQTHAFFLDPALQAGTAVCRQALMEEPIETLARVRRFHFKSDAHGRVPYSIVLER